MWSSIPTGEPLDKIKGIQAKEMPKEWYTYKANKINVDKETGEILDDEETIRLKEFNSKIMVNKKPYFFIYNYPELENDYNKFMSLVEDNCILRFCKTFSQLEEIGAANEEEEIFLNSVKYKYPVFKNTSIMNKICYIFENEFKNIRHKVKDSKDFDYRIYRSNNRNVKDEIFKAVSDNSCHCYVSYARNHQGQRNSDKNIYGNPPRRSSANPFSGFYHCKIGKNQS